MPELLPTSRKDAHRDSANCVLCYQDQPDLTADAFLGEAMGNVSPHLASDHLPPPDPELGCSRLNAYFSFSRIGAPSCGESVSSFSQIESKIKAGRKPCQTTRPLKGGPEREQRSVKHRPPLLPPALRWGLFKGGDGEGVFSSTRSQSASPNLSSLDAPIVRPWQPLQAQWLQNNLHKIFFPSAISSMINTRTLSGAGRWAGEI